MNKRKQVTFGPSQPLLPWIVYEHMGHNILKLVLWTWLFFSSFYTSRAFVGSILCLCDNFLRITNYEKRIVEEERKKVCLLEFGNDFSFWKFSDFWYVKVYQLVSIILLLENMFHELTQWILQNFIGSINYSTHRAFRAFY